MLQKRSTARTAKEIEHGRAAATSLECEIQAGRDHARRAAGLALSELTQHVTDILFTEQVGDIRLKEMAA